MPAARPWSVLALLLTVAVAEAQQHPNLERGFKPERLYNFTGLDSVNVFNGNLNVKLPLGLAYPNNAGMSWSLRASYNSKLWDFDELQYTGSADPASFNTEYVLAVPSQRANAGFGWLISLGRLIAPDDPHRHGKLRHSFPPTTWLYESPDGADFEFKGGQANFHHGLTTDGSYLRLQYVSETKRIVEFPSGSRHTFELIYGRYHLTRMEDPFGNFVEVRYPGDKWWHPPQPAPPGTPSVPTQWQIVDRFGRTGVVNFREFPEMAPESNYRWVISSIDLPAFNGGRAVYQLEHELRSVLHGCSGWVPPEVTSFRVPILRRIIIPDGQGSRFTLDYNELSAGQCEQGTLRSLSLPTGGSVSWTYQTYVLSSVNCYDHHINVSAGVKERILHGFQSMDGTNSKWEYVPRRDLTYRCEGTCGPRPINRPQSPEPTPVAFAIHAAPESTTTVIGPGGAGDHRIRTVHYFSTLATEAACPINGETHDEQDYGLPFTRRSWVQDDLNLRRYLSTRTFDHLTGEHLRSTYVRYERDGEDNERVVAESTVHHQTGDVVHVTRGDFDGFGHYRTETTAPNADFGPKRTSTTTYKAPLPNGRWILGLYDSVTVSEEGAFPTTTITKYCFDQSTGFLQGKRVLAGTSDANVDVMTKYEHAGNGNVTAQKWFGGDPAPGQSSAPPLPPLCGATTAAPAFETRYTYANGLLATSQDTGASFVSSTYSTDPSTGLLSGYADSAGFNIQYRHDVLGRLIAEEPQQGAMTSYVYGAGSSLTSPARVEIFRKSPDGAQTLTRSDVRFDLFGRVWLERQLLADGTMSVRETRYDAEGRKGETTEPAYDGSRGGATHFVYDPLGRALEITAPDGHRTTFRYFGDRLIERTVTMGLSANAETAVMTRERYDAYGRLIAVTEDCRADRNCHGPTTDYTYDVAGRLRKVHTIAEGVAQTRTFSYDGRGFLLAEKHPEKPDPTTYAHYDAKGRAREQREGGSLLFHLRNEYDAIGRLVRVRRVQDSAVVKELVYDAVDGYAKPGFLVKSERLNDTAEVLGSNTTVSEFFKYRLDGRLANKTTMVTPGPTFDLSYQYDLLGNPTTIQYPSCENCGTAAGASPLVTNRHTNGFLTEVVGYTAGAIQYHPNGMITRLVHTNGVVDETAVASHGMVRPQSITVSNYSLTDCVTGVTVASKVTIKGHPVTLIAVHGAGQVTYEWYQGLRGDTSGGVVSFERTLLVNPAATTRYWVRVRNACGGVAEAETIVGVQNACAPTTIIIPPSDVTVLPNTQVRLYAGAKGVDLAYEWRRILDNALIGTTSEIFVAPSTTTKYVVTVTSRSGCGTDQATVNVIVSSTCSSPQKPGAKTLSKSGKVVLGGTLTLTAQTQTASSFQWQSSIDGFNFYDIPNATTASYVHAPSQHTYYRVIAATPCGSAISDVVAVAVVPPVAGDFNGDALSDVVWRDYANLSLTIWNNVSEFDEELNRIPTLYNTTVDDAMWRVHAIGDVNGDGRPDLIWRHNVSGQNAAWLWDGHGFGEQPFPLSTLPPDWKLQGAGDINGDGRADLVFRNYRFGYVQAWKMNGTAVESSHAILPGAMGGIVDTADPAWKIQAVGDFDRDAVADLLWRHARDGRNAAWYLNAQFGVRASAILPPADAVSTRMRGAGDYDGDGHLDVLWQRGDAEGTGYYWKRNNPTSLTDWSSQSIAIGNAPMSAGSDVHVQGAGDHDACVAPAVTIVRACRAAGGFTLSVSGAPAGSSYRWLRDGAMAGSSASIHVTQSGEYTAEVTTGEGCVARAVMNVTVTVPAAIAASNALCAGGSVTLTATGGDRFLWSGPGAAAGPQGDSITVTEPGTYSVSITDSATSCTRSAQYTVVRSSPPEIQGHPLAKVSSYGRQETIGVWAPGTNEYDWYEGPRGDTSRRVQSGSSAEFTTPPLTRTTRYWVRVRNACGSVDSNESVMSVPDAPRVHAAADAARKIVLTWPAVAGASEYVIQRAATIAGGWTTLPQRPTAAMYVDDVSAQPVASFLYRVKTVAGTTESGWSNVELATSIAFTDDPVRAKQTVVRAVHLAELRTAVNAVRAAAGLTPMSGAAPLRGDVVRAIHVEALRAGLAEALAQLQAFASEPALASPIYDDSPLAAGTPIRAVHVQQLRNRTR